MKHRRLVNTAITALILSWNAAAQAAPGKNIIGWVEYVHVNAADIRFKAKMDTGADTSSVNARILNSYFKGGDRWVRFRLEDAHGHTATLERKVVRYAKIKRKLALSITRPVIKLDICLGNVRRKEEVSLAERKNFKYQVLIGRNFLKGVYIVDAEKQFTTRPQCRGVKGD